MGAKGTGFDARAFPGLLGWYKLPDKSQVTLGTGIASVNDLGPVSNDVTQVTAADQPTYDRMNGRWMMKGNGTNQNIGVDLANLNFDYISIFLIHKSDATQTNGSSLLASDSGYISTNTFQLDYSGDRLRVRGNSITDVWIDPSAGNRELSLAEMHFNIDDPILAGYSDGVLTDSTVSNWGGAGGRIDTVNLLVDKASSNYFDGWIGEALVYASNDDASPYRNRAYIAERLMEDWKI